MKITQGFVAQQPDGNYLYIVAGQNFEVHAVPDIEMATVRHNPGSKDHRERGELKSRQVLWVPVVVRREVIRAAT